MASNGKLPKGWKTQKLSDLATEVTERCGENTHFPVLSMTKYDGFVRSSDYFGRQVFSRDLSTYKVVRRGQFAYATIHLDEGSIDLLTEFEVGLISPMYTVFETTDKNMNDEFLRRLLKSEEMLVRYGQIGQGSINRRKSIGFSTLSQLKLPVPPIETQKAISEAIRTIDEAIEATRVVIDQTRRLKTALLQDLLTNGLPGRHKKFTRVYRIGKVPKAWSETRIEQAAEVTQGIALGPSRVARQNPTPYLRVANVHQGVIHLDEIKCIETTSNEREQYALELDDVLMVEGHANIEELGRAALVPPAAVGMVFQNHLFRVRTDRSKLDPRFLTLWINSHPGRAYFKIFGGTTSGLNTVGSNQIRTLRLPLPPIDEQKEICDLVEAIEQRGLHSEKTLEQLQTVKSALSQGLLTGRIPVKGDK